MGLLSSEESRAGTGVGPGRLPGRPRSPWGSCGPTGAEATRMCGKGVAFCGHGIKSQCCHPKATFFIAPCSESTAAVRHPASGPLHVQSPLPEILSFDYAENSKAQLL